MHTAAIDRVILLGGPILDASLCVLLLAKHRWRAYPALFLLVLLDLLTSVIGRWIGSAGTSVSYLRLYLSYDVLNFSLELMLLFEIAKAVLKPTGIWTREAFKPLALMGVVGAAAALIATFLLPLNGLRSREVYLARADIFTGLITSEMVIAMMLASKEVGLGWRNHVMAVGQGLMFWCLFNSTVEGIAVYLQPHSTYYGIFYYLRAFAYMVTVAYWTVSLWRNEPARKPISPALRKYVLALHERVHYDLGKVGH